MWGRRSLSENFLEHGEDLSATFHPGVEAFDAVAEELAFNGVLGEGGGFAELLEFGFSAIEVGADLFTDESADEAFEFGSGFVVGAAVAVAFGFTDRAEGFEGAQALAG